MTYQSDIINKLTDNTKWPYFQSNHFWFELDNLAQKSFEIKTIEGYLAALLIYHQLTEDLIRCLIASSDFFIQLKIFPNQYQFNPKNLKEKMFGQLLCELKNGVINNDIEKFVNDCHKINKIRIEIVHKLTLKKSVMEIEKEVVQTKATFENIWESFTKIFSHYYEIFGEHQKNINQMKGEM